MFALAKDVPALTYNSEYEIGTANLIAMINNLTGVGLKLRIVLFILFLLLFHTLVSLDWEVSEV